MKIEGRTALVTGAAGGLGQAIARALAQRGATLVLSGRSAETLEPLAGELGASFVVADLSRREAVAALVEQAGPVEILVANAGLPADGPIADYTVAQIDRALDVNLRAPILLAHAVAGAITSRGGEGHLVFISSTSGKVATHGSALYSATKYGLRGFASSMRQDLHGTGIGVSAIFPGPIAEAGMFAMTDARLPVGAGIRTPRHVGRAVVRAIERDRAEIDVVSMPTRLWTRAGVIAPGVLAAVNRWSGAKDVAAQLHDSPAHRARR